MFLRPNRGAIFIELLRIERFASLAICSSTIEMPVSFLRGWECACLSFSWPHWLPGLRIQAQVFATIVVTPVISELVQIFLGLRHHVLRSASWAYLSNRFFRVRYLQVSELSSWRTLLLSRSFTMCGSAALLTWSRWTLILLASLVKFLVLPDGAQESWTRLAGASWRDTASSSSV